MANSTISIIVIIGIFIGLLSIFLFAYHMHKKNNISYEEFCEKVKNCKYLYIRYHYDNPLIPTFEEKYEIINIENGWIKLFNFTDNTDVIHLPLKEAYNIFELEPYNSKE